MPSQSLNVGMLMPEPLILIAVAADGSVLTETIADPQMAYQRGYRDGLKAAQERESADHVE